MADVDFLVRPESFTRIGEILEELGFYTEGHAYGALEMHEQAYLLDMGDGRRMLFEAHRYLFDPVRFPIDYAALWGRSVASTLDGISCRRLAAEDNFVHIALHAAVHRLQKLGRTLRDLEFILRAVDTDLGLIVRRAREWRVTRIVWLMLVLLDALHPVLSLGESASQLEPSRLPRFVLQYLVPKGEDRTRISTLNHRVQAALLWPWLFDSASQTARIVTNHPRLRQIKKAISSHSQAA
jgi:hypothetical protein